MGLQSIVFQYIIELFAVIMVIIILILIYFVYIPTLYLFKYYYMYRLCIGCDGCLLFIDI